MILISIPDEMRMEQFTFEGYWIIFDKSVIHEKFDDNYCYGIKFFIDDIRYELIHNRLGLTRIFIHSEDGSWKDIPFHAGTINLLPKAIVFRKIPEGFNK